MLVGVLVEVVGVVSNVEKEVGKLVGSMPRFRVVLLNLCDTLEVFCRPPSGGPEFTSIGKTSGFKGTAAIPASCSEIGR